MKRDRATAMGRLASRLARLSGWRRGAVAMALGVSATAALPPLHLLPLLVVAFSGLLWLVSERIRWRTVFWTGWWFGLGHFASGLYWFAHALLTDPEKYGWLIPPVVLGVSALLALFPALAVVAARLCPPGGGRVVGLALAWVVCEWLRGWVLTGFPWNLIAYAWAVSEAMIQVTALVGAWGLSLITVLAAAAPAILSDGGGRRWLPTGLAAALLALTWTGGAVRLAGAGNATVDGVRLRLVQANVAQHHKWNAKLREEFFARHLRLSADAGESGVTQVIWPETAIPYFIADDPARRRVIAEIVPEGGLLISGALRGASGPNDRPGVWNTLHAIDAGGRVVGTYDKAHLVPFGEYVPLRRLLPITKLTEGTLDFSAGPGPRTLTLPGLPPVSPLICYEAIFPDAVTDPKTPPQWLLNVTNDAWFGPSSGPYQHFASARFRAVEQGIPLVRVANTGISGVVDAHGRVTARLGLNTQGRIDAALPVAVAGRTLYARYGEATLVPLLLAALIFVFSRRRSL